MKWRGVLVVLMIVSLVAGATALAQGANVCPAGNVKFEVPSGYEYNDGSGWIEASEDRTCWGANEGYRVTGVCIYVGGPDKEQRLINLGPGDGCWDNPEKYGISHVVLYTEAIPAEPTPTDVPPEPTPTEVPPEPTPTDVPEEPTPTPKPTDKPKTPVPPTATPKPEEPPVPTPTPEEEISLPPTGGSGDQGLVVPVLIGLVPLGLTLYALRRRKA